MRRQHADAADLDGLARIVKRKLKKIPSRPRLIGGCLAGTGLTIDPGDHMHYEFNLLNDLETAVGSGVPLSRAITGKYARRMP